VLRTLVGDKDFSLEHLYAVLLHYKQPVDGLEDLKDDQQLWDLFNGNSHAAKPTDSVGKRKTSRAKSAPTKARTKTTVKQPAKKRAIARRAGAAKLAVKRSTTKPRTASKRKRAISRAGQSTKSRPRQNTSTKKR
jgi:hypothetical protein